MEIITGFQGKDHVTARQISRLIESFAGGGTYVLSTLDELKAEVLTVNSVRISTGDVIAEGCYYANEAPEELVVENGVTGLNRNDIIVLRYIKADPAIDEDGNPDYTIPRVESAQLAVVKGTPSSGEAADPAIVTASIYDENTSLAEYPLYRLPIKGLTVGAPEPLFVKLPPIKETCDGLAKTNSSLSTDLAKITTRTTTLETGVTGLKSTVKQQIVANHVASKAYSATANQTIRVVASFNVGSREPFLAGWDTGNINMTIMSMTMSKGSVTAILRNLSGTTQSGTMKFSIMGVMAKLAS